MKFSVLFFAVVFILSQSVKAQNTKTLFFDDLPLQTYSEGIRPVSTKSNYWKNTIKINGVPFSRGFGAQSPAVLSFMLDGNAKKFYAEVGVDDSSNTAIPLTFYVLADQRILFQSIGPATKLICHCWRWPSVCRFRSWRHRTYGACWWRVN